MTLTEVPGTWLSVWIYILFSDILGLPSRMRSDAIVFHDAIQGTRWTLR